MIKNCTKLDLCFLAFSNRPGVLRPKGFPTPAASDDCAGSAISSDFSSSLYLNAQIFLPPLPQESFFYKLRFVGYFV